MQKKINPIQDLRGIAVLYVVLFHAGNIFHLDVFAHGGRGVDLFFIISGFIISYIHRHDKGVESALIFLKKRIVRIYPSYILIFIVMFILLLLSGTGGDYQRSFVNVLRNMLLIQAPSLSIHPYAWSLVYEMYYYVTFCVLVIIFRLHLFVYCLLMALPVILLPFFIDMNGMNDMIPLSFYNLFFISGALVGKYFDKIPDQFGIFSVVGILLVFMVIPISVGKYAFLICAVLLFIVYSKSNVSIKILNAIGNSSYSIYLVHAIVLSVAKHVIDDRSILMFIGFVVASLGLGHVYYIVVEKRLIKYSSIWLHLKKDVAPSLK